MRILIPSPLRSYTKERMVDASGATLAEVLIDLDRQYPGIRFRMIDEQDRMRPHVRFFLERNPRYHAGTDLACVAEISPENLRGWVRRDLEEAAAAARVGG